MWNKTKDVSELIGKTITRVVNKDDEELIFTCEDGSKYKMYHMQDCCEYVRLEDIVGELNDLVGSPLVNAEETSNRGDTQYGSQTWTFYHFTTQRGDDVSLRWLGESNGYYSESVDFIKL